MRSSKMLPVLLAVVLSLLIALGLYLYRAQKNLQNPEGTPNPAPAEAVQAPNPPPTTIPSPQVSANPSELPSPAVAAQASAGPPDLTEDANGLSKATAVITTAQGVIKFKFYPKDAPNTVNRIVELIGKGFYDGLIFHRVIPGFVVQGGDPQGTGTGGSGQKLKAEFNKRRHIEGTVAMARAQDPDSADSQFYISLGNHPHLDGNYTVFGQVIEGMDVARKVKPGDKIQSVRLE